MSLQDRALAGAAAELRGDRQNILGATPLPAARHGGRGHRLPPTWTQIHVLDRLEEAFHTLRKIPDVTRPRGFGNAMPAYKHEFAELVAQSETGELERMLRLKLRVRIAATPDEIARMNEALYWPMQHLNDKPEVARAVQLAALWAVVRTDPGRRCAELGIPVRTFLRRKMHGLNMITVALIRGQVPVS